MKKRTKIGIIIPLAIAPVLAVTVGGVVIATTHKTEEKEEEIKTIKSIKIVDDSVKPISVEEGETSTSDPIEVKCYSNLEQTETIEPPEKPKLILYDDSYKSSQCSWITINSDNQIVIDQTATEGTYTFYLRATCTKDNEIITSEYKQLNVEITFSGTRIIDKITLDDFEDMSVPQLQETTKIFTLRAWSGDREVAFPTDRSVETFFWATDTSSEAKPEPGFAWSITDNKIKFRINCNSYYGRVGTYNFNTKVYFKDDKSIIFTKTITLTVYS